MKYKRCCLDVARQAHQVCADVEARIGELGDLARRVAGAAWLAEFERGIGPKPRIGGVSTDEAAWLDSWAVTHAPVIDGRTPLEADPGQDVADDHLRRSEITGWWIRGGAFPLAASPWREERAVTLHTAHDPFGTLIDGGLLLGRGVDLGAGHIAVVGRPVVAEDDVVSDLLAVLAHEPDRALLAALRWPEERVHTAEGELVQECMRTYGVADPEAMIDVLRRSPGVVERTELITYWDDDVVFHVTGPPPRFSRAPAPEPGVAWELCDEDRQSLRVLGEVTVSPEEGDISLSAPTRSRADLLMAALPLQAHGLLGAREAEELDLPEVLPRVRRERFASMS